ncbi:hypothetical protein [Clostridium cochlearium]|uniref:DUF304 domain-containing protein n=1 Tax=Clostridium cochlearium TaxID=1494 RepID=A0A239YYB6_CLOCO|nr:hypothetical protein [Clostridium cochlearium]MBV1821294.1 hypothetical protein [Bacteroidales bacterium MSK.15.36]NSJ92490.1 hypothetical protein [Coprococcus sp. MSK.21.13]MBE6065988.1 hypothetical protein [Clostridium cochlearium]MBU5270001.1 hypothetical protein [Clostridium cochlearium]MCG4572875.1 hypothetical protein [Clostridium cochlearium]
MGNMYKETVTRKKAISFIKVFIILISVLFLLSIIEIIYENNMKLITIIVNILFIIFLFTELFKCKVKYTYSIIADQFIIHKISGLRDKVVENIKIKDIEYIGKDDLVRFKGKLITNKKYMCHTYKLRPYCCIYRENNKYKKFYFQPSMDLIEKIEFNKNRQPAAS